MPTFRSVRALSATALALALLAGCSTVPPPYLLPMWSAQAPTKYEVKEHWNMTMAGVEAKSDAIAYTKLEIAGLYARP